MDDSMVYLMAGDLSLDIVEDGHQSWGVLPGELMPDILSRLPVKFLIRFRSVSKPWKNLVDSPTFKAMHFNRSNMKPVSLLRHCHCKNTKKYTDIISLFSANDLISQIPFPYRYLGYQKSVIVGSSYGLVCICRNFGFMVWNPATTEFRHLPCPPSDITKYEYEYDEYEYDYLYQFVNEEEDEDENVQVEDKDEDVQDEYEPYGKLWCGFSFLPAMDDYKLVNINMLSRQVSGLDTEIQVYTLSTDSWREFNIFNVPVFYIDCHSPAVNVDGSLYWIGVGVPEDMNSQVVVSFNMVKEMFTEKIMVPCQSDYTRDTKHHLTLIKGSLGMFVYPRGGEKRVGTCYDLWIMNQHGIGEDPWTKILTIGPLSRVIGRPISLWLHGEIIFISKKGHRSLYDPNNNEIRACVNHEIGCRGSFYSYVESLAKTRGVNKLV